MARLTTFLKKPLADQRLLVFAALLYVLVALAVRVLPFGLVQRALGRVAAPGPGRPGIDDDARVVRAVRTVAFLLPGANCLTEALVAQCLLARHDSETTLCFGVSRARPSDRPFDAHAWLERGGSCLVGTRAIVYDPLRPSSRCVSSPSLR